MLSKSAKLSKAGRKVWSVQKRCWWPFLGPEGALNLRGKSLYTTDGSWAANSLGFLGPDRTVGAIRHWCSDFSSCHMAGLAADNIISCRTIIVRCSWGLLEMNSAMGNECLHGVQSPTEICASPNSLGLGAISGVRDCLRIFQFLFVFFK